MAENSKIEWCDHTFNPWSGCAKVSPGCAHCYAETLSNRAPKTFGQWGKGQPRKRTSEANWKLPLRWNNRPWICDNGHGPYSADVINIPAPCCECGEMLRRPRVFCASLADWLDDEVPIEWLASLLDLIRQTPNLDWLLLTKRPQNFQRVQDAGYRLEQDANWDKLPKDHPAVALHAWIGNWTMLRRPPANVWIGTTVEDQKRADERIPALLSIPARVRFLSCEPLLGPVDLWDARYPHADGGMCGAISSWHKDGNGIHWVIAGSESGAKRRPSETLWFHSLRDQCVSANTPFFMKQMEVDGKISTNLGSFPKNLQTRGFPQ